MIKKISLLFVFLILFLFSLFCQNISEELILKTETGNISGTLLVPQTFENKTVALIIAGSGPTDRNGNNMQMTNNSLKMIAEVLAENGIASLRYDKRGVAKSMTAGLLEYQLRFEDYVNDALQFCIMLKKDPRFNHIIVIGHSEGSLIGMIAANRANADKYISLAGVGTPAADIFRTQLKNQSPELFELSDPILSKLEQGDTVATFDVRLFSLFRPTVQPYLISWFRYNPQKEIAKLTCETLIVQGTTDIQVGVENAELLAAAKPDARKIIIEGMNHVLKDAEANREKNLETYNQPNLPLNSELVKAILNFLGE